MPFSTQTFSFEEVLSSTKMNQLDTNIDEVRRSHKGSTAPSSPTSGTLWLDDTNDPTWSWQMYDGTDWIELGKLDSNANTFSGAGPANIVALTSLSGQGSSYSFQESVIDGLNAWRIWYQAVSGSSSVSRHALRFYNDETLISSNYTYQRDDTGSDGDSRWQLTGNFAGAVYGPIDVWIGPSGEPFCKWDLVGGDGSSFRGLGRYEGGAITDLDGFQLLIINDGNFDGGSASIYSVPQWQHG